MVERATQQQEVQTKWANYLARVNARQVFALTEDMMRQQAGNQDLVTYLIDTYGESIEAQIGAKYLEGRSSVDAGWEMRPLVFRFQSLVRKGSSHEQAVLQTAKECEKSTHDTEAWLAFFTLFREEAESSEYEMMIKDYRESFAYLVETKVISEVLAANPDITWGNEWFLGNPDKLVEAGYLTSREVPTKDGMVVMYFNNSEHSEHPNALVGVCRLDD